MFYCIVYLLAYSLSYSQVKEVDTVDNIKDQYIQRYDNFISGRIGFSNSFNQFTIKKDDPDRKYTLTPNQSIISTFTVLFHFLEIDIPLTPKFLKFNRDDDTHGKTKYLGLGTRFYHGKWMQSITWNTTKGFYADADDLGLPANNNIIFPNLKVFKIGGSTSYIFNSNYSFRAVNKQKEWQKKSAGSFVPTMSYYFTKVTNDTPETNKLYGLAIGPSYHYNWVVMENFLISAGAYVGIGYNSTRFEFADDRDDYSVNGINYATDFQISLGYNKGKFFSGANVSFDSLYPNIDPNTKYKDQQQFFEIYLGYRFNAPKRMVQKMDDVEDKMGL